MCLGANCRAIVDIWRTLPLPAMSQVEQIESLCFEALQHVNDGPLKQFALRSLAASYWSLLTPVQRNEVTRKEGTSFFLDSVKQLQLANDLRSLSSLHICKQLVSDPLYTHIKEPERFVGLILNLAQATEVLLTHGGDDRMTISATTKVNKYNASTIPNPSLISRASCTCSPTTSSLYSIADSLKLKLLHDVIAAGTDAPIIHAVQSQRERLKSLVSLHDNDEVLFCPSGSDAELYPLLVALALQYDNNKLTNAATVGTKVYNYVFAAGEVGSGTAYAAAGKHFSSLTPNITTPTPNSSAVVVNERLDGIKDDIEVIEFPARSATGAMNYDHSPALSTDAYTSISTALTATPTAVAVIHCVVASKTGLLLPPMSFIQALQAQYPHRVVVVIDACQLRCDLKQIGAWTSAGYVVLLTGSKYYAGPPFSGAVTLPHQYAALLDTFASEALSSVPEQLRAYFTAYELPDSMPHLKKFLGNEWWNIGLLLRWECALSNMEKYQQLIYDDVTAFICHWVEHVKSLVKAQTPYLQLLSDEQPVEGRPHGIVSVSVHVPSASGATSSLNAAELKVIYNDLVATTTPILVGQPVALTKSSAVLRIALGADIVIAALAHDNVVDAGQAMHKIYQDDVTVVSRLAGIVKKRWNACICATIPHSIKFQQLQKAFKATAAHLPFSSKSSASTVVSGSNAASAVQHLLSHPSLLSAAGYNKMTAAAFFDMDAVSAACQKLQQTFPPHFIHCYAMKAAPLPYLLHCMVQHGLGIETVSIMEVRMALLAGCDASKIVYNGPCKTVDEITEALQAGITLHVNSFTELDTVVSTVERMRETKQTLRSIIGLRLNPLVGAGSIASLSVATEKSKFGIILCSVTQQTIIDCYAKYDFLNAVMCHVGSQGMSIDSMVQGASQIWDICQAVNKTCRQITLVDIGGGLGVRYDNDDMPDFEAYVAALRMKCPDMMSPDCGVSIMTEFGKALVAKTGFVVTGVHDVLSSVSSSDVSAVVTHVGADCFVRAAYAGAAFQHRLVVLDSNGVLVERDVVTVGAVAGPLCFAGDNISTNVTLPRPMPGDYLMILDAGANTLSLYSRHCSRQALGVFGYCRSTDGDITMVCIKKLEQPWSVVEFWE